MGGTKKSAVDRVIEKLEGEKLEIDRTIARLRAADAATAKTRKARKTKPGAVEQAINEGSIGTGKDRN